MNKIFETLYKEFREEAEGAALMFTNDRVGYDCWYKNHLYGLCLKYGSALQPAVQADAKCHFCGKELDDSFLRCDDCMYAG